MDDIKKGGIGGLGLGAKGVVLDFHNAPDRKIGPQAEFFYCGGDAEWKSLYCGTISMEYAGEKFPLFLGLNNRRKLTAFNGIDFYLNGVLKGGPVYVPHFGLRSGVRFEAGLGAAQKVGSRRFFWDLNAGHHLFYDNQAAGDFWEHFKLSPSLIFGLTVFLEYQKN
ncbi:MAG: hypothetical protein U1D33_03030 [bacterium]|nr:hypothetical protein [bacterium]